MAGIAGEISTLKKFNWRDPLVAAQSFEYKVSNILDKSNIDFDSGSCFSR